MPNLINKTSALSDADWSTLADESDLNNIESEAFIACPLSVWEANKEQILGKNPSQVQLQLQGFDEIESIIDDLPRFGVISIHFKEFKDGRGYSLARLLRERYGFKGELRATGDVTQDQLFYLSRCGFDTFLLRSDQDPSRATGAFSDFSEVYQAAVDQPNPVYRR